MKTLAVFTLFLLSASTASAGKGSLTVESKGNHAITVWAYDWDDGVRGSPASTIVTPPAGAVSLSRTFDMPKVFGDGRNRP